MIFNTKGKTCDTFCTPDYLYNELNRIFTFEIDAACTTDNCKSPIGYYYDKGIDGLEQEWNKRIFCNPPFSEKGKWIKKAHDSVMNGQCPVVIMILPVNSMETKPFFDYIYGKFSYKILQGRVQFIHPDPSKNIGNNSGTVIVYFFK